MAPSSLLVLPREALQSGPPPGSWFRGRPCRADCLALLAPRGWRITHCTHCVRFVQTDAPSQSLKRAGTRAPQGAALLSPSQIARQRPELQGAYIAIDLPLDGGTRQLRRWLGPTTGDLCAAESAAKRLRRVYPRASSADSAPLFDHSERSERREFGAAEPRSEHRGESARRADPCTMSTAAGRATAARKPGCRSAAKDRQRLLFRPMPDPGCEPIASGAACRRWR